MDQAQSRTILSGRVFYTLQAIMIALIGVHDGYAWLRAITENHVFSNLGSAIHDTQNKPNKRKNTMNHLNKAQNNNHATQDEIIRWDNNGEKPTIDVTTAELPAIVDAACKVLQHHDFGGKMFLVDGILKTIELSPTGEITQSPVNNHLVRLFLSQAANWMNFKDANEPKRVEVRLDWCSVIIADAPRRFCTVERILRCPAYIRGEILLDKPGYNAETKCYLAVPTEGSVFGISEAPSPEEVRTAVAWLRDPFLDFPLKGDASFAHCVSAVVQQFARDLIDGATPLHVIRKHAPGTGASLITDIISIILTGERGAPMTEAKSKAEWTKQIGAVLHEKREVEILDNVSAKVDTDALASLLTAQQISARILGRLKTAVLQNRCLWLMTANNPSFSDEMADRCISIYMDAGVACPQDRVPVNGWIHPRLVDYVRENRWQIVWAALTLIQNWICAKRDGYEYAGPRLNRFSQWSEVMGGILELAGIKGFLANRDEFRAAAETESSRWQALVIEWHARYGAQNVKARDLIEIVSALDLDFELSGTDAQRARQFSYQLAKQHGRVYPPYQIGRAPHGEGVAQYRLRMACADGESSAKSEGDESQGLDTNLDC